MTVYWNETVLDENGNKRIVREALKRVEINCPFAAKEQTGFIAALYMGKKGVLVDMCVQVPLSKIEAYQERWLERQDTENDLTEEEIEQIEREAPFQFPFTPELTIDGERLSFSNSQGDAWNPLMHNEAASAQAANAIPLGADWIETESFMESYGCDKTTGWFLERATFRWKNEASDHLQEAVFGFRAKDISYGGEHFETEVGCSEHKIRLEHPVTKESYEVTVLSCEDAKMDMSRMEGDKIWPSHYAELSYTVSSGQRAEEFLIKDCAESDRPVSKRERENDHGGKSCSAISVIGGADGPTSVFAVGSAPKGAQCRMAMAALHFEPVTKVEWRTVFQVKEQEDFQIVWKRSIS